MASISDDMSLSSSIAIVPDDQQQQQPQTKEKGYLAKRKDFLGKDEYADSHPNRTYYFKRNQDVNEVIETCTRKLHEDPNNLRALYLRGSSFFKKNFLDACIQDLSMVLRAQPTHQDCLYTRGLAYFKCNKQELAIKDLTRVLELNPDHVNAAYSRAACYNKMGLLTEAIEDYNFALSKDQSSNGSVASGGGNSNLMPPPSTPLLPSSSRDELASFGGSSSVTDTPRSVGTTSLGTYLHKSGRVETPRTINTTASTNAGPGTWSAENSPPRHQALLVGSGNRKLDAIDAAGIFSLYEEGYESSSSSGTAGGSANTSRSQSRGRNRVDSNDGSYLDSTPGITPTHASSSTGASSNIGNRRPSFSNLGSTNNINPGNNNGRSTTPGGGNGFSFKSLSELKRPPSSTAQTPQSSAPSTPMAMGVGTGMRPGTVPQDRGDNQFYPPPPVMNLRGRAASGNNSNSNTMSNASASSLPGYGENGNQQGSSSNSNNNNMITVNSFNSNPLFPPPGVIPSSSSPSSSSAARPPVSDYDLQAADQFHAEAYEMRKKGNFPAAIEEYSKALKFHPMHFKSLFNRGFAYDKVGQYEKAIQDYSLAIEIESSYPLCYYNRGITYDHMNALQQAFDDFSMAIRLYEEKLNAVTQSQGSTDTALITQSYIDFYQNRAFCSKKMSRLEQAIQDFSSVVNLSEQVLNAVVSTSTGTLPPQQQSLVNIMHNYLYKAYYNRSLCYERVSSYQDAIQDISKAIQEISLLHSGSSGLPLPAIGTIVNCLTTRANLYDITQQVDQAFNDYAMALKYLSSPQQGPAGQQPIILNQLFTVHSARGKLYSRLESHEKAIEDYTSILSMIPRNYNPASAQPPPQQGNAAMWWTNKENLIETYHSRALCCKALQDFSGAIQDYQQIVRLRGTGGGDKGPVAVPGGGENSPTGSSNIVPVYQELANCYKKVENYEAAIDAYSKMIDYSPKNVKAYNSRAFLFAKLGRFKDAVQDYSTVIHIDPTNSHAYHNRGISYDKMGLIDQAISDFSKVFELDAKQSMTSVNAADPAATAAVDKVVAMMKPVPIPVPGNGPPVQQMQAMSLQSQSLQQPQPRQGGIPMQQASQQFSPLPSPSNNSNTNHNTAVLPQPPVVGRIPIVRPPSVVAPLPSTSGGSRGPSVSPPPPAQSQTSVSGVPINDNAGGSIKIRTPPKVLPLHPSMMNQQQTRENMNNPSILTPSPTVSSVPPPLSVLSNGGGRVLIPQIRPSVYADREKESNSPPPPTTGLSATALLQQQQQQQGQASHSTSRSRTPISVRSRVVDNSDTNSSSSVISGITMNTTVTSSVAPPMIANRPQTSFLRTPTSVVATPQPSSSTTTSVTFAPDTIDRTASTPMGAGSSSSGMMNAASFLANLRGDGGNSNAPSGPISVPMGRFSQRMALLND